jgi:two-component system sensor histidine kinase KdpD
MSVGQVMRNLLSNAGKYGPDVHSVVRVVAEAAGDEVKVRVLDDGPGFGADDGERLFQLFFRSPDARSRRPGAGIGLYATRALVDAMGGRVWALARAPSGSEFGFTLPIMEDEGMDDADESGGGRLTVG